MIFDQPDVAKSSDSAFLEALLYEPISVALVIIQKKKENYSLMFSCGCSWKNVLIYKSNH